MMQVRYLHKKSGFTLIELIITVAIIGVLASATMPLLKMTVQRTKENELKANLREIRSAIDAYKKAGDEGKIEKKADATGYPPSLEILVEGVENIKSPAREKVVFVFDVYSLSEQIGINGVPYAKW